MFPCWKFHVAFNKLWEIPLAISSVSLEIPYPQSPVWFFSGIAQYMLKYAKEKTYIATLISWPNPPT